MTLPLEQSRTGEVIKLTICNTCQNIALVVTDQWKILQKIGEKCQYIFHLMHLGTFPAHRTHHHEVHNARPHTSTCQWGTPSFHNSFHRCHHHNQSPHHKRTFLGYTLGGSDISTFLLDKSCFHRILHQFRRRVHS